MFASALITFRETLEAALVVGIILSFLTKTQQFSFKKYVWMGVASGVGVSILLSFLLHSIFGGLIGKAEEVYEGTLMFVTAGFLTWMILWVHRQKGVVKRLHDSTAYYVARSFPIGLSFLVLTSVMREGVETVLYLQAIRSLGAQNQLLGAVLGVVVALLVGRLLFTYSLRISIQQLLKVSGAILLLFAAGLVSHGVHEFQEAGILPLFSYDPLINITNILDHHTVFGSFLRTLFGYTATPSLLELLSYGGYVFVIFLLEVSTNKKLYAKQNFTVKA